MKRLHVLTQFILALIFICGLNMRCKQATGNNSAAPPRVLLVEKSQDSSSVEKGIDAEDPRDFPNPDKNGIVIQWYPVDFIALKAYDIYFRAVDSVGGFQKAGTITQQGNEEVLEFLHNEVGRDTIYYYYVVARSEDDEESSPSIKDHYKLLSKPTLRNPYGGQNYTGLFEWTLSDLVNQFFIFRLQRRVIGTEYLSFFLSLHEISSNTPEQSWTAQQLGLVSQLAPGDYRWRIDVRTLRDNRIGSESSWGEFKVF